MQLQTRFRQHSRSVWSLAFWVGVIQKSVQKMMTMKICEHCVWLRQLRFYCLLREKQSLCFPILIFLTGVGCQRQKTWSFVCSTPWWLAYYWPNDSLNLFLFQINSTRWHLCCWLDLVDTYTFFLTGVNNIFGQWLVRLQDSTKSEVYFSSKRNAKKNLWNSFSVVEGLINFDF